MRNVTLPMLFGVVALLVGVPATVLALTGRVPTRNLNGVSTTAGCGQILVCYLNANAARLPTEWRASIGNKAGSWAAVRPVGAQTGAIPKRQGRYLIEFRFTKAQNGHKVPNAFTVDVVDQQRLVLPVEYYNP